MPRTLSSLRSSRGAFLAVLTALTLCVGWLLAPLSYSQAQAPATNNAALNAVLAKLKTQQDTITANQAKIETQTAALKEELRQARIYVGRSGAGRH